MSVSPFGERLKQEFEARRAVNSRYSQRAFARFLGLDHATLAQVLKGRRKMPISRIRNCSARLGLDTEEAVAYCAAEHAPDAALCERREHLRHKTAEAQYYRRTGTLEHLATVPVRRIPA
jgi:transcriptional regulator with XRE-family HTH domain